MASRQFQRAFHDAQGKIDMTIKDEDARRLRLKIFLLEAEKHNLREQLDLALDQMDVLAQNAASTQKRKACSEKDLARCEDSMKVQAREISSLKAELLSLNIVTVDYTRFLGEKLELKREIAILRPEVEHLRSQVLSFQTVISEKQALQRHLQSLKLELEEERLASRRAARKLKERACEQSYLNENEERQRQLISRQPEKDRATSQRELKVLETQQIALENKPSTARVKLNSTHTELKNRRVQLNQRGVKTTRTTDMSKTSQITSSPLSREVIEVSAHSSGQASSIVSRGLRLNARGRNFNQTVLREKSMFSITPYLHRAIDIRPEAVSLIQVEEQKPTDCRSLACKKTSETLPLSSKAATSYSLDLYPPTTEDSKEAVLTELMISETKSTGDHVPNAILNIGNEMKETTAKTPSKSYCHIDLIEPVSEPQTSPKRSLVNNPPTEHAEPRRKRRKLLKNGMTTFNDDESGIAKQPAKMAFHVPAVLGKHDVALQEKRSQMIRPDNIFRVAFSPLKRDRVKAKPSFLD